MPQDDLVHAELDGVRGGALQRQVPSSARTTQRKRLTRRVEQTLRDLGLEGVKNLQIGRPEKKVLSGGQRKRVNIALELVTDPVILFLDEPTSGLAADDTTALIALLSDLTKQTGKTIIMTIHQPGQGRVREVHALPCHGLRRRAHVLRPDREAYRFFGTWKERQRAPNDIDNPRDMFEMLAQRERPIFDALRMRDADAARGDARRHRRDRVAARVRRREQPGLSADVLGASRDWYWAGTARSACDPRNDPRAILPAAIAVLQGQGPRRQRYGHPSAAGPHHRRPPRLGLRRTREVRARVVPRGAPAIRPTRDPPLKLTTTADDTAAVFFLVVAAVWCGTSNAAREIVSERAIYMRERMVTLGLFNYVFSKYLLLAFFCLIQCACLLGIVFPVLGFPGGTEVFLQQLGALVATSLSAVAVGLLISTVVTSAEAAMALTPIALIPQVILGGLLVPMSSTPKYVKAVMQAMPSRWGFEATVVPHRLAMANDEAWLIDLGRTDLKADFIEGGKFKCALAQMASDAQVGAWGFSTYDQAWIPYAVLGSMTVSLLVVLCAILKRRDPV